MQTGSLQNPSLLNLPLECVSFGSDGHDYGDFVLLNLGNQTVDNK